MRKDENLLLLAIEDVYKAAKIPNDEIRYLSPNIGIIRSLNGAARLARSFIKFGQPYRLTEGRVVHYRKGICKLRINLKEIEITEGQLVITSPGTVVEFIDISPDCELSMLAFSNNLMEGWIKEDLVQAYMQGRLFMKATLSDKLYIRIEKILVLIWDIVHDDNYSKDEIRSLIFVLFHQINNIYQEEQESDGRKVNRPKEIFNNFLSLINKHAFRERNIAFYADRLYITPRYLSTLIKQESGRTVMDWINDAAIQEIKLQLRHTDKLVFQISDDMNFPNPSFFTKYFRRLTGMTPKEYREMVD